MEIKRLMVILIALFGVFITLLAMGNSGVALESAEWTTISQNASYFIVYLGVLAIVVFFIREWLRGR